MKNKDTSKTICSVAKFCAGGGAKLVGGMSGVGISVATGNPYAGAAAGTIMAHILERVGNEIIDRRLAPRQEFRAGKVFVVAHQKLNDLIECGHSIRQDNFFGKEGDDRTDADEITEAVFRAAMNSVQENKLEFIGNMIANIAIDSDIDATAAYLLITNSESISYRSFCIIKFAHNVDQFEMASRPQVGGDMIDVQLYSFSVEIFDLVRRG